VEQRRALRHASGAAGVLQEGDVIRPHVGLNELELPAGGERIVERVAVSAENAGPTFTPSHEQVAHAANDHVLDAGLGHHHFQRGDEILQKQNRLAPESLS